MSSKTLLMWVVVAIVVIAGGFYLYGGGSSMMAPSGTQADNVPTTPVPGKTSSSDEIIDYIVGGLSNDEKATTNASIDGASAPSQTGAASILNTNF